MTFRGTFQQGVIVLADGQKLEEGQEVVVLPLQSATVPAPQEELPGFGLWRDRTDLPEDSAEAGEMLRRMTEERKG
jgi:hypothetical protein